MNDNRKLYLKSFGCQMNVYDSRRMADSLAPLGFDEVSNPEDADLIILNTCNIREKAAEKVYSELGRLRALKTDAEGRGRQLQIAVAGCVAQAEGEEIIRRAPAVDIVVGPQSYHRLPEFVSLDGTSAPRIAIEFPPDSKFDSLPDPSPAKIRQRGLSAFLTVQEGCDKFCTFCVVPYTRGGEVSRPVAQIVAEAEKLAAGGVREITIIGQNVNGFHGPGPDGRAWSLARLLHRLADVPGVIRLRYTTSHPRDMDDALIAAHRDLPALMPFLHLPVQSGSDRMLQAMNRRHSRADYLRILEKLWRVRPDIGVSSDFIVGFPGESEDDHRASLDLVDEVAFSSAFSFQYSPRPGTPASGLPDPVEPSKARERLLELQARIEHHRAASHRRVRGKVVEVLFERAGRYPGQIVGRTPYMHTVQVTAPDRLIGAVAQVRVTGVSTNSLFGQLTMLESRAEPRADAQA